MKIIVDAMGGDFCPGEIVKGCINKVNEHSDLKIVLVGKEEDINKELEQYSYNKEQIIVENASEVITCHDAPVDAIRSKKDSSIVKAFDYLKNDEDSQAFISAGSTGAVLTGAFLKLGRINGIKRPALAPTLPTVKGGEVIVVDSGANMDCTELNLVQFALMGNAYMKYVKKVENPRIAILNVGAEDEKGNALVKTAFPLLKELDINFVGSAEARDVLSGDYDVIVCDGFAGNVLIKSIEGTMFNFIDVLKQEFTKSLKRKIGALMLKSAFGDIKKTFRLSNVGGAPFLGVNKLVVKAHGNSKAKNIECAIEEAISYINADLIENIKKAVNNTKSGD